MKIKNIIALVIGFILFLGIISAALDVSLADHGSNIRNKTSGSLLSSGNLRVEIYDALSGGSLVYNETFTDSIINGSWNVMLGENSSNPLSLEFGRIYYKDYVIDGENVNFTNLTGSNVGRQFFYSPLGDINVSYIVNSSWITWANAINGTLLSYADALNNTLMQQANWNATNTSYLQWSNAVNGTLLTYAQALNNTLMQQANWNATNTSYTTWAEAINGTLLKYSDALNGTLAQWSQVGNGTVAFWSNVINGTTAVTNAANTFGNFNQTFNGTTFFLWSLLNRIGIGTTTPQNTLNVIGVGNFTGDIFSREKNLSVGYDYAVNSTGEGGGITWAEAINGTLLTYAQALNNTLMQQANWNATNTSYTTWANAVSLLH